MKHWPSSIVSIVLLTGVLAGGLAVTPQAHAQTSTRVFEMRTYTTHEGKLEDLLSRFRKDEGWIAARTASEANGPIIVKVQSVFMDPTNFSNVK